MMLYPPMAELVNKVGSRYLLVNLVARRARNIALKAEEEGGGDEPEAEEAAADAPESGEPAAEE